MRIPQPNAGAMVRQESGNPTALIELDESCNSQQMALSLAGNHKLGGGIAFNRVAADAQPHKKSLEATEEGEEKSEREEPLVALAENVSLVRKNLLITAGEALDGARVAAELVMKDAMDALQRTKQRLMEILLPHSSSQAPPAADMASETSSDAINPDEDKQQSAMNPATRMLKVFAEPTLAFVFPSEHESSPALAVGVMSRL